MHSSLHPDTQRAYQSLPSGCLEMEISLAWMAQSAGWSSTCAQACTEIFGFQSSNQSHHTSALTMVMLLIRLVVPLHTATALQIFSLETMLLR